jgi:hypothetical protein
VRSGDLASDLSQGGVLSSFELESIIENRDDMRSPMPFTDEPRARFQRRRLCRLRSRLARCVCGIGLGRRPRETLPGPFREPAEFEFLHTVSDGPHQQIATDARRLQAAEPPPFLTQRGPVEVLQSIQATPQSRGPQICRGRIDGRRAAARRIVQDLHLVASPPIAEIR